MRERPEATALLNPVRVELLRWIGESPGMTQARLARRVPGVSRRYARHHLEVLVRAGLIAVVRHGNTNTYMLKGQPILLPLTSPADAPPATSPQAVSASALAAELNHRVRRLIFDALRLHGPCHYAQMVRAWDAMGVPEPRPGRCDITYHGKRLERLGLVARSREAQHVVWSLRIDAKSLGQAEAARYVQHPHFKNIYDAARRSPALRRRLFAKDAQPGPEGRTVADLLHLLSQVSELLRARPKPAPGTAWGSHVRLPKSAGETPVAPTEATIGATAGVSGMPPSFVAPVAVK